jgi:hypothetical protein
MKAKLLPPFFHLPTTKFSSLTSSSCGGKNPKKKNFKLNDSVLLPTRNKACENPTRERNANKQRGCERETSRATTTTKIIQESVSHNLNYTQTCNVGTAAEDLRIHQTLTQ